MADWLDVVHDPKAIRALYGRSVPTLRNVSEVSADPVLLLTGATGRIGAWLVRRILMTW